MKSDISPNGTFLSVMSQGENMPAIIATLASKAEGGRAFRLAGGCSGMNDDQRSKVVPYFIEALRGFNGVAISGGTLSGDGKLMVTNVPGALVADGNNCIALGTLPRTADMSLPDNGSLQVSQYGDVVDRTQHGCVIVQRDASQVLEWDGDLQVYLNYLLNLKREASFDVAVIVFNGGGVTKKELVGAINNGIPLIVIEGSGRAADEFAAQYNGGTGTFDAAIIEKGREEGLVHFAQFSDPNTLREVATQLGILPSL